ncbi:MAG: Crp/Fnr family transcriptional regulator [Pseudomonadota bacterium]|nr:Crp/Fnr family transcriptional regulator [Pseudomonadota bacterium]
MSGRSKTLRPGEALIAMGEEHEAVYRVRSGWFAQTRALPDGRNQIIEVFLPGDLVGVKTMFLVRQFETVEALTVAAVEHLHCRQMRELSRSDPDVGLRLMWQILEDERRLHAWVVSLGQGDADERMTQMLLDFHSRLAHADLIADDASEFPLPMTQQHMADLLGLSEVHVNRVLRRLREKKLVTMSGGKVRLLDPSAVRALAFPVQDGFERQEPGQCGRRR